MTTCSTSIIKKWIGDHHKKIQKLVDLVVARDKSKFSFNPNALECFLPENVYPDTPKLELRKTAFWTLSNIVTVSENGKRISPFAFTDSYITPEF